MMRCKGRWPNFHKMAMMKYFHTSDRGNHFACPECGRTAIVPHPPKKEKLEEEDQDQTAP